MPLLGFAEALVDSVLCPGLTLFPSPPGNIVQHRKYPVVSGPTCYSRLPGEPEGRFPLSWLISSLRTGAGPSLILQWFCALVFRRYSVGAHCRNGPIRKHPGSARLAQVESEARGRDHTSQGISASGRFHPDMGEVKDT